MTSRPERQFSLSGHDDPSFPDSDLLDQVYSRTHCISLTIVRISDVTLRGSEMIPTMPRPPTGKEPGSIEVRVMPSSDTGGRQTGAREHGLVAFSKD